MFNSKSQLAVGLTVNLAVNVTYAVCFVVIGVSGDSLCVLCSTYSLSLSHSRSGGRVTAPIVSRKLIMRRGSVESM